MREAADPRPAVRPIARIFLRVDMECSLISSVNLTGLGKPELTGLLLAERASPNQARP